MLKKTIINSLVISCLFTFNANAGGLFNNKLKPELIASKQDELIIMSEDGSRLFAMVPKKYYVANGGLVNAANEAITYGLGKPFSIQKIENSNLRLKISNIIKLAMSGKVVTAEILIGSIYVSDNSQSHEDFGVVKSFIASLTSPIDDDPAAMEAYKALHKYKQMASFASKSKDGSIEAYSHLYLKSVLFDDKVAKNFTYLSLQNSIPKVSSEHKDYLKKLKKFGDHLTYEIGSINKKYPNDNHSHDDNDEV